MSYLYKKAEEVETLSDLILFIRMLRDDYLKHTESCFQDDDWENGSIDAYLDSIAAWAEGSMNAPK